jgi:hypothetical protein
VQRALALALGIGLATACVVAGSKDAGPRIRQALVDLARAGFEFDADVRFRTDPYAVCAGVSCATLVVLKERRTVLLAQGALDSDAALRASLLDIWERYESPHPDSVCDELRGMLRVVRDGPRGACLPLTRGFQWGRSSSRGGGREAPDCSAGSPRRIGRRLLPGHRAPLRVR